MRKRILVVEDNPDILEFLELFLDECGYKVYSAESGEFIFQQIDELHPDLILLDMMLPGISGMDICHDLKNTQTTKHIPVIAMSAHPKVNATIKDVCADEFIAKPFDLDNLTETIEKQLAA